MAIVDMKWATREALESCNESGPDEVENRLPRAAATAASYPHPVTEHLPVQRPFASHRVNVGAVTLNVIDVGTGPAVVLLHGFPDRATMWSSQIQHLADRGHRVIAPDLRGFGDSDRPNDVDDYRLEFLVGDVAGLLSALDVPNAAIVGHDWGASIAWAVAAVLPSLVTKLAVLSVGHPGAFFATGERQRQLSWYVLLFDTVGVAEEVLPYEDWRWYRDWAFDGAHPDDNQQLRTQLADLSRPGALETGLNYYRANFPAQAFIYEHAGSGLPHVSCPVLGMWSDCDMALTEEQMTRSADFVDADFRYVRVHGVGHWMPSDAADRVNAELHQFLDSRGPSGS